MVDRILHQPNSILQGGGDVGGAVQRCRATNVSRRNFGTTLTRQQRVIHEKSSYAWEASYNTSETNASMPLSKSSSVDNHRNSIEATGNISVKHLRLIAMGGSSPVSSLEVEEGISKHTAIRELLELSERVKRKRRHETQKPYRKKKVALIVSVTKDIQELRENVTELQHQHHQVVTAISPAANAWKSVIQYFSFIESVNLNDQFDFIRATMTPDVMCNSEYGFEAVVRGWCIIHWFDDVKVELDALNRISRTSMIATNASRE